MTKSSPTPEYWHLREAGIPEIPLFGHSRFRFSREGLAPHRHENCLEICCLTEGRQVFRVSGHDYVLSGGEIFLTHPDETHDTGGEPRSPGELYWLQVKLPPTGGGEGGKAFLGMAECGDLLEALRRLPRRHFPATPKFIAHLRDLYDTVTSTRPHRRTAIRTLILQLLMELTAAAEAPAAPLPSAPINMALRHIDEHIEEPLTIPDLAAAVRLSTSWFKARFRKEIGMPPAEYVLKRKVEIGRERLHTGRYSVTEVAHTLGFSSSQYFATVYRRLLRRTPSSDRPE